MVHCSSKTPRQPQLQSRHKAQQGLVGIGKTHLGQKQTNALTSELAVEEHALLRARLGVLALRAPGRMVAIQLLGLALALQGAALGADAKTRAAEFLPADLHRHAFR